ncbi:hypothetical protein [Sporosarcina sp. FA9]|uniref:hypothetical protein n=1 Tax=Sporosarcina sp. FA9 TaxID=3413030 RepID=UPI003F65B347
MYKDLSPNLKISITRSITQTFEQYMSDIAWSEDKFRIEDFVSSWQQYITTKALWYTEIPDDIKLNPGFHEELAVRINEIIDRILQDPPTDEQIATIQMMQEKQGTHYEYDCKAQAAYVEGLLKINI